MRDVIVVGWLWRFVVSAADVGNQMATRLPLSLALPAPAVPGAGGASPVPDRLVGCEVEHGPHGNQPLLLAARQAASATELWAVGGFDPLSASPASTAPPSATSPSSSPAAYRRLAMLPGRLEIVAASTSRHRRFYCCTARDTTGAADTFRFFAGCTDPVLVEEVPRTDTSYTCGWFVGGTGDAPVAASSSPASATIGASAKKSAATMPAAADDATFWQFVPDGDRNKIEAWNVCIKGGLFGFGPKKLARKRIATLHENVFWCQWDAWRRELALLYFSGDEEGPDKRRQTQLLYYGESRRLSVQSMELYLPDKPLIADRRLPALADPPTTLWNAAFNGRVLHTRGAPWALALQHMGLSPAFAAGGHVQLLTLHVRRAEVPPGDTAFLRAVSEAAGLPVRDVELISQQKCLTRACTEVVFALRAGQPVKGKDIGRRLVAAGVDYCDNLQLKPTPAHTIRIAFVTKRRYVEVVLPRKTTRSVMHPDNRVTFLRASGLLIAIVGSTAHCVDARSLQYLFALDVPPVATSSSWPQDGNSLHRPAASPSTGGAGHLGVSTSPPPEGPPSTRSSIGVVPSSLPTHARVAPIGVLESPEPPNAEPPRSPAPLLDESPQSPLPMALAAGRDMSAAEGATLTKDPSSPARRRHRESQPPVDDGPSLSVVPVGVGHGGDYPSEILITPQTTDAFCVTLSFPRLLDTALRRALRALTPVVQHEHVRARDAEPTLSNPALMAVTSSRARSESRGNPAAPESPGRRASQRRAPADHDAHLGHRTVRESLFQAMRNVLRVAAQRVPIDDAGRPLTFADVNRLLGAFIAPFARKMPRNLTVDFFFLVIGQIALANSEAADNAASPHPAPTGGGRGSTATTASPTLSANAVDAADRYVLLADPDLSLPVVPPMHVFSMKVPNASPKPQATGASAAPAPHHQQPHQHSPTRHSLGGADGPRSPLGGDRVDCRDSRDPFGVWSRQHVVLDGDSEPQVLYIRERENTTPGAFETYAEGVADHFPQSAQFSSGSRSFGEGPGRHQPRARFADLAPIVPPDHSGRTFQQAAFELVSTTAAAVQAHAKDDFHAFRLLCDVLLATELLGQKAPYTLGADAARLADRLPLPRQARRLGRFMGVFSA